MSSGCASPISVIRSLTGSKHARAALFPFSGQQRFLQTNGEVGQPRSSAQSDRVATLRDGQFIGGVEKAPGAVRVSTSQRVVAHNQERGGCITRFTASEPVQNMTQRPLHSGR